jgi:hypothetical protein
MALFRRVAGLRIMDTTILTTKYGRSSALEAMESSLGYLLALKCKAMNAAVFVILCLPFTGCFGCCKEPLVQPSVISVDDLGSLVGRTVRLTGTLSTGYHQVPILAESHIGIGRPPFEPIMSRVEQGTQVTVVGTLRKETLAPTTNWGAQMQGNWLPLTLYYLDDFKLVAMKPPIKPKVNSATEYKIRPE